MNTRIFLLTLCVLLVPCMYGQVSAKNDAQTDYASEISDDNNNYAVSIGFLMGGGSLIGLDLEYIIPKTRLGLQVGAGITSFGGGVNYHLKEGARSSFFSIQYYYQGFGDSHYASWLGPMFNYRAKKWFQAGIGIGSLLEKGPKWYDQSEKAQKAAASMLFNVGIYF